ncbi:MAG: hypothetical protein H7Y06_00855 [Opitutaceae bacterium]|nr:hypothetical protein [Opitutaceae bacterium]
MKRYTGWLLLSCILVSLVGAQTPATFTAERHANPPKPGIVSFSVTAPGYQKGTNRLEVLCPDVMPAGKRFPVLIVLPVNTGIDGNWGSPIEEMRKLNLHNLYQVICVVPAYDVEPWFGDMPAAPASGGPRIRQQAYVTDVVVPLLDREFPTQAERSGRFLIGFSKSGFGAFGLLLRNPGMFDRAAIYDCADPVPKADIYDSWGFSASYGPRANFDKEFHIPTLIARNKEHFQGNTRRITLLAGSLAYGGVETIHTALKENKVAYTYLVFPGMGHSWNAGWLKLAAASLLPNPPPPAR